MEKIAIVIIGYNRLISINRLIASLFKADYLNDKVPLIISLDKSDNLELYKYIENLEWPFGEKKIICHKKRLGLREHVLKCGDLTENYENIIVLEDDIFLSPLFYKFSKEAIEYYKNEDKIAGISLYSFNRNQYADKRYIPLEDEYDTFFIQNSQSWGQIWSKKQWKRFKKWYLENKEKNLNSEEFPSKIASWPESSWLKYHMKYIQEKNLFFVYPKISLSTNFLDMGEHVKLSDHSYQVKLLNKFEKKFKFADFKKSSLKYDIFFEYLDLGDYLGIEKENLTVDLYGKKKKINRYWLTTKKKNYKIIKSYGMDLIPIENNIILENLGQDIFLYDTNYCEKNKFKNNGYKIYSYEENGSLKPEGLLYITYKVFQRIKNKILKLLKW